MSEFFQRHSCSYTAFCQIILQRECTFLDAVRGTHQAIFSKCTCPNDVHCSSRIAKCSRKISHKHVGAQEHCQKCSRKNHSHKHVGTQEHCQKCSRKNHSHKHVGAEEHCQMYLPDFLSLYHSKTQTDSVSHSNLPALTCPTPVTWLTHLS